MCQQPRVYHFSKTCTFYGDFGTYFLFRFDLYQSFQGTHHPPQYTPLLNNSVISTTKVKILTFRSAYQNKLFQANTKLITQTSSFRRFKPNKLWLHRDTSFNAKPIKMLSFPSVAEAYRPDPPSLAGVNFFLIVLSAYTVTPVCKMCYLKFSRIIKKSHHQWWTKKILPLGFCISCFTDKQQDLEVE